MKYFIEDFIDQSNRCLSSKELFLVYEKYILKLGYSQIVYTYVTNHLSLNRTVQHGVECSYPDDWMKHYQASDYWSIDPVVFYARHSLNTFRWDDVYNVMPIDARQDNFLNEAKDAGLCDGLCIPLHGHQGELAGVGLARPEKSDYPDDNMLSQIQLITNQFHLAYCALERKNVQFSVPSLTKREVEILKWWAIGKTGKEVAFLLQCSEANVKWHVRSVYDKLMVNSRISAVTKAIRLGIIPLDVVANAPI